MFDFGHIMHGPFIVIFGGRDPNYTYVYLDSIYILDLRRNCGWIESPLKCPRGMRCNAVLDANQRVHLRNATLAPQGLGVEHWTIDLIHIIPELLDLEVTCNDAFVASESAQSAGNDTQTQL